MKKATITIGNIRKYFPRTFPEYSSKEFNSPDENLLVFEFNSGFHCLGAWETTPAGDLVAKSYCEEEMNRLGWYANVMVYCTQNEVVNVTDLEPVDSWYEREAA